MKMAYGEKYTIGSKWKLTDSFYYGQMYAENITNDELDNHVYKEIGEEHGFILENRWETASGEIICEWTIPKYTLLEIIKIFPMYGHLVNVNGLFLQFCAIEDLDNILERVE